MLDLLTGSGGSLAVLAGVVAAILAFVWRLIKAGKDAERVKNLEESNKQWVEADEIIGDVHDARRKSGGGKLLDDDGFKRP